MRNISRREFVKITGSTFALASVPGFMRGFLTNSKKETAHMAYFERFGVDEEIIQKILMEALVCGGEYADLFFQHKLSNFIQLEDNIVNSASTNIMLGVGIRVLKGNQTGYSYTEDLSLESMIGAARTAANISRGGRTAPLQEFHTRELPNYYTTEVPWEEVGIDRRVNILKSVNEQIFSLDSRIIKANVYFSDDENHILIATSEGRIATDYQPMLRISASCTAEQENQRETNWFNYSARDDIHFITPERLAYLPREAVRRTVELFEAKPSPAGEMPVILKAGSSGILLHEAIGHGMEADFNRIGTSIYAEKLNKKVAADFISIVDSGTNPNVRGSINVDDEGVPSQETYLVEKGVLRSYMHDRISAKHYGVKLTGNGRRQSFKHFPMPRMRNTYMLNGPHTFEEVIASVKYGILADQFTNGQVNIGPGDFTFYVKSGALIENGKITAPIKDVNIIGNGPEVLERVTMVANDMEMAKGGWTCGKNGQSVPVSMGIPSVLVSSVTVGGRM